MILQTNRLCLRRFTTDDAPFMLRLLNEPTWIEYIGDRNVRTLEDAVAYLKNGAMQNYSDLGYGFYLVMDRETGESIGTCGFTKRPVLQHPDFGFAFLPEYTGQGYAFEVAAAALDYAEEILQLKKVEAITTQNNERSIRLLTKLGFRYERTCVLDGEELFVFGMQIA
jgi:[ribosomal protein S5]-alanine N-acetyltransferase